MNGRELLEGAEDRIRKYRTGEVTLSFAAPRGTPLKGLSGRVRLLRHRFKLGCNAFMVGNIEDAGLQNAYQQSFAALFNYATLPFYWGHYEKEEGKICEERLRSMAEWCRANGITPKGHPLAWHEVWPSWAGELDDGEALRLLEKRVRTIPSSFDGLVDIWDVLNEATVSHNFENALGRWIKKDGAAACVTRALEWAHEANPRAKLIYNDFNISRDFANLVRELLDQKAPLHSIGIQSHMHQGNWSLEKTWDVCERYARFGLPLHFTETTVLSGRLKPGSDTDWHKKHTDWHSTPDGEAVQNGFGKQFYTLLFSHPEVEAVTWWDFSDHASWQGAPAGLLRKDMSPKPLYESLCGMFNSRWSTDVEFLSDASGCSSLRCFYGDYSVEGTTAAGEKVTGGFCLEPRENTHLEVVLQ